MPSCVSGLHVAWAPLSHGVGGGVWLDAETKVLLQLHGFSVVIPPGWLFSILLRVASVNPRDGLLLAGRGVRLIFV